MKDFTKLVMNYYIMVFRVDDERLYKVGDELLYNGIIVDEDVTITAKIRRMTVGIVTAIIGNGLVAVFRN